MRQDERSGIAYFRTEQDQIEIKGARFVKNFLGNSAEIFLDLL